MPQILEKSQLTPKKYRKINYLWTTYRPAHNASKHRFTHSLERRRVFNVVTINRLLPRCNHEPSDEGVYLVHAFVV